MLSSHLGDIITGEETRLLLLLPIIPYLCDVVVAKTYHSRSFFNILNSSFGLNPHDMTDTQQIEALPHRNRSSTTQ